MGYYRNYYRQSHSRPERVTDATIELRLKTLLENKAVPENTVSFLESLLGANEKYSGLTSRQYEAFQKVEKRFSAEKIAQRNAWASEYTEEKRRIAKICAKYYIANPPYFHDLATDILSCPEFVPTERQWRSLCENKYAKKVIAATDALPLYETGTWVRGRANAHRTLRDRMMVVIEADAQPVTAAARGTKIYRVLPVGSPATILCEERDLKKAKKTV